MDEHSMDSMDRGQLLRRAAVGGLVLSSMSGVDRALAGGAISAAVPSNINVGVFAGDLASVQKSAWIPTVESRFNTKVSVDDSFTSGRALAALQAGAGRNLSLVMMDEIIINQAKSLGLLSPLNLNQLSLRGAIPRWALQQNGYGLAFALSYMSILYNPKVVPEPKSWLDLFKPEYKGKVVIPTPAITASIFLLILGGLALQGKRVPRGGRTRFESAIERGFEFIERLKPQLDAINTNDVVTFSRLAAGDIGVVAPSFSKYALPYRLRGVDLRVAFPKEGMFVVSNSFVIPKGSPAEADATRILDLLLAPRYQGQQAVRAFVGPVNTRVRVRGAQRLSLPGAGNLPDRVGTQSLLNFGYIRQNFAAWQERMRRAVG